MVIELVLVEGVRTEADRQHWLEALHCTMIGGSMPAAIGRGLRGHDDLRNRQPLRGRLSNARIGLIVKTAVRGVYLTDIYIRPVIKPAAWIGSGIGIPDHRCATGEQHRQTNDSQSSFKLAHRSVPRYESTLQLRPPSQTRSVLPDRVQLE
jgi:hypothetical protein